MKRPTSSVRNPVNCSRACLQSFRFCSLHSVKSVHCHRPPQGRRSVICLRNLRLKLSHIAETLCRARAALNVAEREPAAGLGERIYLPRMRKAFSPAAPSLHKVISFISALVTTRTVHRSFLCVHPRYPNLPTLPTDCRTDRCVRSMVQAYTCQSLVGRFNQFASKMIL